MTGVEFTTVIFAVTLSLYFDVCAQRSHDPTYAVMSLIGATWLFAQIAVVSQFTILSDGSPTIFSAQDVNIILVFIALIGVISFLHIVEYHAKS